jgi:hypothetical protein
MQEPTTIRAPSHFVRVDGGSFTKKYCIHIANWSIVHVSYKLTPDDIAQCYSQQGSTIKLPLSVPGRHQTFHCHQTYSPSFR